MDKEGLRHVVIEQVTQFSKELVARYTLPCILGTLKPTDTLWYDVALQIALDSGVKLHAKAIKMDLSDFNKEEGDMTTIGGNRIILSSIIDFRWQRLTCKQYLSNNLFLMDIERVTSDAVSFGTYYSDFCALNQLHFGDGPLINLPPWYRF
jgi:hypothetical protein